MLRADEAGPRPDDIDIFSAAPAETDRQRNRYTTNIYA